MLNTSSDRQDIMKHGTTRTSRSTARPGHHETRHDQVEDVVQLASLNSNRERDVDVDFRTAIILFLVPLGWNSFKASDYRVSEQFLNGTSAHYRLWYSFNTRVIASDYIDEKSVPPNKER